MKPFEFSLPTRIIFGTGTINRLPELIEQKSTGIMVITDRNLASGTDIIARITSLLKANPILVYDEVEENPSFETIDNAGRIGLENKAGLVVGLGGGSSMDAAKGVAVLAANPGHVKDFIDGKTISHSPLPLICIPTTSGTGSEVTPFAVFTDKQYETKTALVSDLIYPRYSIIDPQLTYSMPQQVIINTGLDALSHSIEALFSKLCSDLVETISLKSIRIIADHLEKAVLKEPESMEQMAYASMLGGIAIAHASTILPHIMGYPLTVHYGIPHGRAGMLMIPAYLNYLEQNGLEAPKLIKLNEIFQSYNDITCFLEKLRVPASLSSYGITSDDLPPFVEKVINKDDVKISPGKIDQQLILQLYHAAL